MGPLGSSTGEISRLEQEAEASPQPTSKEEQVGGPTDAVGTAGETESHQPQEKDGDAQSKGESKGEEIPHDDLDISGSVAEGEGGPLSARLLEEAPASIWRSKAMLVAYTLLLLLGFTLSLLADLSRLVPALIKVSLGLQVASTLFFLLAVPLTYLSGSFYHRRWRFWQPFAGGIRFVWFQALAWTMYALCLVLAISCLLFWSYMAKAAFGVVTSFGALGVLSQVLMVTSLFVYERKKRPGSGGEVRRATRKTIDRAWRFSASLYSQLFYHINIVLALVAVALAVLAEYCWVHKNIPHHQDFARVAGAVSVVFFTTVVFNTYGVGGHIANGRTRQWRFYQPFIGGAKFIVLQALSWSLFTVSVVVEIAFIISTFALGFELFVGAAVVAGTFFILSEVLMILSLSFFMPTEKVEGKRTRLSFIPTSVDEESLEQFRRLTVITFLSNMQYLPFLLPILPFLCCGLTLSEAGPHWFGFFCCLAAGVVVNAYVKTMLARMSKASGPKALLAKLLPMTVYLAPAIGTYKTLGTRGFPGWVVLTCLYYAYVALTFHGNPAVTGRRYLGPDLSLFGMSLYGILDGIELYFKGTVHAAAALDPKQAYVYAFHPHGVQPFTVVWIQLSRAWRRDFKDLRFSVMTASVMHFVPLMRDILQWLGGREVSRESLLNALGRGESILLVPGGQQEMMESQSKAEEVRIITRHVGFIRVALQNGVPVVPVVSFGEVEVMDFVRLPSIQRFFISRIGIPVPFFPYGLLGFPIPRPVPVTVVFGKPIPLEKVAEPTPAQVEAVAKQYFKELQELFDEWKAKAPGAENHRLVLM